jgi:hypothetical protein
MTEDNQERGNPEPIGASSDFFEALEDNVNSAIQDNNYNEAEVTQAPSSGPVQETHAPSEQGTEGVVDWEKRYKDSTREAQKMNAELQTLKPYVPVLNAMKKDTGLVEHVRDYLREGGKPAKSLQDKLGLDEDFQFNAEELGDPDSDSSKLLNAQVDAQVQQRLGKVMAAERQQMQKGQANRQRAQEAKDFQQRHNMTPEQFQAMMAEAGKRRITLDDVFHLLNKDKVNQNVANNTKDDMLKQMKNVRNIPTSASGTNSAQVQSSPDGDVFDKIVGSDGDIDNLFG